MRSVTTLAIVLSACAIGGLFIAVLDATSHNAPPVTRSAPVPDPGTSAGGVPVPAPSPNEECPYTPFGEPMNSYQPNGQAPAKTGDGVVVIGTVIGDTACAPLAGALVEIWHEGAGGRYSDEFRHVTTTGEDGTFTYETAPTTISGEGEPHIHFKISGDNIMTVWGAIPMPGGAQDVPFTVVAHEDAEDPAV